HGRGAAELGRLDRFDRVAAKRSRASRSEAVDRQARAARRHSTIADHGSEIHAVDVVVRPELAEPDLGGAERAAVEAKALEVSGPDEAMRVDGTEDCEVARLEYKSPRPTRRSDVLRAG